MASALRTRIEDVPGARVLHLAGHLGIDGMHDLSAAWDACLADGGGAEIRLDLHGLETADTTALGMLLVLRERGHARHRRLSLARTPEHPVKGLDSNRVVHIFRVPPAPGVRA